jgi:hypothetical protein
VKQENDLDLGLKLREWLKIKNIADSIWGDKNKFLFLQSFSQKRK